MIGERLIVAYISQVLEDWFMVPEDSFEDAEVEALLAEARQVGTCPKLTHNAPSARVC